MDAITQSYKYGLPEHRLEWLHQTCLWNFVTIYDRNFRQMQEKFTGRRKSARTAHRQVS